MLSQCLWKSFQCQRIVHECFFFLNLLIMQGWQFFCWKNTFYTKKKKSFFQSFFQIFFFTILQKLGYFYMRIGIQCPNVLSWHIIHPPWCVCGVLICFGGDILVIENWHPLLHYFRWMVTRWSIFFIGSYPYPIHLG